MRTQFPLEEKAMARKKKCKQQAKIDFENPAPRSAPLYRVVLQADGTQSALYVKEILRQVLGFGAFMAEEVANKVCTEGTAPCTVEQLEHAEFHCDRLVGAGLMARVEPG